MFGRWFKRSNRLDHPDPGKRLLAIQALSASDAQAAQQELGNLVRTDADAGVAQAAIEKLSDPGLCAALLDHEVHGPAVAVRVATLVSSGVDMPCRSDPRVMTARIDSAEAHQLETLLEDVDSIEHCAALALRFRDEAREKVLAHPLLNNEQGLAQLVKQAKGRDKQCHRFAKTRLDSIKTARGAAEEHLERLTEIDRAIDKTLVSEPDPYVKSQKLGKLKSMREEKVAELNEQLQTLASAGGDATTFALPANPLAGLDLTPPPPAADPYPDLVGKLEALRDAMRNAAPLDTVSNQRDEVTNAWLAAADKHPPNPQQHAVFESVSAAFQQYRSACQRLEQVDLERLLTSAPAASDTTQLAQTRKWLQRWRAALAKVRWPVDHTPPPRLTEAEAAVAQVEELSAALQARHDSDVAALANYVKEADAALAAGQMQAALAALKQARRLQKSGLHNYDRELASLSARVDEFRDWQQFATNPKRAALLEEIQRLADQPVAPADQAAHLKALREQWRQLGRPVNAEEAEQQKRFDALAEQAFEPCRAFFAEQAEQRAANLAQRVVLCDQLEAYIASTDWADADMRAAEDILRTAREEWRKYHPCERKALKPVETRFETLQQTLHDNLKQAWDRNIQAKTDIVERARALLEENLDSQIENAKALQQAWREIGPTPRSADQRLWREFRQVCDQIFAGRDAARQAQQAAYAAQQQALDDALAGLETLLQESERLAPAAWREQLTKLQELSTQTRLEPRQRKRWDDAERTYRSVQAAQKQAAAAAELEDWARWDTEVSRAEQLGETIEAPHKRFAARANGASNPLDWRAHVIEAELAAELPSPPEDQERRLQLQVELMNSGTRPQDKDYKHYLHTWCEAGPKDAQADALRARLFTALKARLS